MSRTFLDGPTGTELAARGVPTPDPLWSAWAIEHAPAVLAGIHADYAAAGATVHTACTFRTKRRHAPVSWEGLVDRAVAIARGALPVGHRIAGSIAPLADCYRPDLSPPSPRQEHRELAQALAAAKVDLLLCETFPHLGEALIAVEEAVATGLETWVAFTAGPTATLLTPDDVAWGAREAVARGARAVLVNCTEALATARYVSRLEGLGVPFGAYANAGGKDDGLGWGEGVAAARAYATLARSWADLGATLLGGCCGTGPLHVRELVRTLG